MTCPPYALNEYTNKFSREFLRGRFQPKKLPPIFEINGYPARFIDCTDGYLGRALEVKANGKHYRFGGCDDDQQKIERAKKTLEGVAVPEEE